MYSKLVYTCSVVLVLIVAGNVSADLLGQWTFDDGAGTTAADISGNGVDGEFLGDPVDGGDHLRATGNGECPAGTEVVLHVDHQQHVPVGNLHRKSPFDPAGVKRRPLPPMSIFRRGFATTDRMRRYRADRQGSFRNATLWPCPC